jgi:pyrroline-5-carboxylate reductase
MSVNLPSIAILGAGSMGGAILSGLTAPGVEVDGDIRVTTKSLESALAVEGATAVATDADSEANRTAVAGARLVILGVKPYLIADVLAEIAPALEPDAIVVSLAVGVTIETMENLVGVSVIRAMPNTPSLVGKGVTGLSAGTRTTEEELALAVALFETVGSVLVVPEGKLDALSTISGSGPAYVFLLIEELTKTAVALGFSAEEAATMVNGTFLGAAELLVSSGAEPAELRRKVTSPKGTTERAIAVLQDADLTELFNRATAAALARARELAAG